MSIVNQEAFDKAVVTLFEQLGAAAGSIVYTDGRIDIKAVQNALRESKCGVTICGISTDAYAAARETLGWSRFEGKQYIGDTSQVSLEAVVALNEEGATLNGIIPEGSDMYRVTLSRSEEKPISFYAILGCPRTPRPNRRDDDVVRGNKPMIKDTKGILSNMVHMDDAISDRPGRARRQGGKKKNNKRYDAYND